MNLPTKDQVRYHGERWAWVLGLALLAYLAFPSSAGEAAPLLETGKFADRDLIAPFTFAVSKSDEELAREAEELAATVKPIRSEEHTSELQSPCNLVCRLLLEKKKKKQQVLTQKH